MKRVESITTMDSGKPDDLLLVSASFEEERCLAAAKLLSDYSVRCGVVVNFESKLNARGEEKKRSTSEQLIDIVGSYDTNGIPRHLVVAGHDVVDLTRELKGELRGRGIGLSGLRVTLDISCLTKIQLAGILRFFLSRGVAKRIRILYSYPKEYNTSGWDRYSKLAAGFKSPIVLPFQGFARNAAETESRLAVVCVGHEGERTFAAWRSADAEVTWLVEGTSENEKVMEACRLENRFLYEYVSRGRAGHAKFSFGSRDLEAVSVNLGTMFDRQGDWQNTQISVIPFGPKPILVGLLFAILSRSNLHAQLVYPVTTGYNSDYSWGIEGVYSSELDVPPT